MLFQVSQCTLRRAKIPAQKQQNWCVLSDGAMWIMMKGSLCTGGESVEVNRRVGAFAWRRQRAKLLVCIVPPRIENGQSKAVYVMRPHDLSPVVGIAWGWRCRFQERGILTFLVQRFDRYCAPDFDGFFVLRLDRDRFSDLRSGFRRLITRPAPANVRRFHRTISADAVGLLICHCFGCWLRRRIRFQCWLKRVVRVLFS